MSPRTWGWTPTGVRRRGRTGDVPTHVGVDRQQGRQGHEKARCPHARGGGPLPCRDGCGWRRMSPRTWGWTTGHQVGRSAVPDVPTHVGVDRLRPRRLRGRRRCPHARGGGPTATCLIVTTLSMSPRTWGWTGGGDGMTRLTPDVPTHVGVDRSACRGTRPAGRCPHARGGGPFLQALDDGAVLMSPRTWGWTVERPDIADEYVGCPHARGGGPRRRKPSAPSTSMSPRTWGWTRRIPLDSPWRADVPTHVGVDRWEHDRPADVAGCPHARGGGPVVTIAFAVSGSMSPRTWGWTGCAG